MVYDSGRKRIFLFGGIGLVQNQLIYSNESWEWEGEKWIHISSTGPAGRIYYGIAYDAKRSRVVLFGGLYFQIVGEIKAEILDDIWEWDGDKWRKVERNY